MHQHVLDLAGTCTGPGPCDTKSFGAGKNWVNKVGGLPAYIRAIAHALQRGGKSESAAIATAVATVKGWAVGRGNVSAATRARAAKAVAEWEAKKAASHALSSSEGIPLDMTPAGKPVSVDLAARTDLLRRAVAAQKAGTLTPKHQRALKTYLTRIRKGNG